MGRRLQAVLRVGSRSVVSAPSRPLPRTPVHEPRRGWSAHTHSPTDPIGPMLDQQRRNGVSRTPWQERYLKTPSPNGFFAKTTRWSWLVPS